ncbi:GST1 [Symbiodinium microadriaticum]|nr:GST1 [Symbiodinium microadriaticum]
MPSYKLTYFDIRGLAENARIFLAVAQQPYEDVRLSLTFGTPGDFSTIQRPEFDAMKAKGELDISLGKVPLLEVDGVKIGQSKAIERYLAKELGLAGSSPVEAAQVDQLGETVRDIKDAYQKVRGVQDEEAKKKGMEKWFAEDLPNWVKLAEKSLPAGPGPFMVGGKVSAADLLFYTLLLAPGGFFDNTEGAKASFQDSPKIKAALEAVDALPQLQDRVAESWRELQAWLGPRILPWSSHVEAGGHEFVGPFLTGIRFLTAMATPRLCTENSELSAYFSGQYLKGELYEGRYYKEDAVNDIPTFRYDGPDGTIQTWQHAFNLQDLAPAADGVIILYHYTNELGFQNVGNMRQSAAELFASLVAERAHFGKGVYTTQYEPTVWRERIRALLNNYSNLDPLRADPFDEDGEKRNQEWGQGNRHGHRAGFCVPLIVPKKLAHNIFERHTPDMAQIRIEGRPLNLGEDIKGRKVHENRDVWVVQITDHRGSVQHAQMKSDALADVLEKRLQLLWKRGPKDEKTLRCMGELASRYQGRGKYSEAEPLLTQLYAMRREGEAGPETETHKSLAALAGLMHQQGKLYDAEPFFRKALRGLRQELGDDHPDTLCCKTALAALLQDMGKHDEAALLRGKKEQAMAAPTGDDLRTREQRARGKLKAALAEHGPEHDVTRQGMRDLAAVLKEKGDFHEADMLYHMSGGPLSEEKPGTGAQASPHALRRNLQQTLEKLGATHPDSLGAMHSLACALHQQGERSEAEKLCSQALKGRREKMGRGHPDTLESMHEMGVLLKEAGRIQEAEQLFREGLESSRQTLGGVHQQTVDFNNSLARMLEENGRAGDVPAPASFKEWLAGHWTPQAGQPHLGIPGHGSRQPKLAKDAGGGSPGHSRQGHLDAEIERLMLADDSDEELENALRSQGQVAGGGAAAARMLREGMAGMFMDENMGLSLLESIDDDFLSQAVFASQGPMGGEVSAAQLMREGILRSR